MTILCLHNSVENRLRACGNDVLVRIQWVVMPEYLYRASICLSGFPLRACGDDVLVRIQ